MWCESNIALVYKILMFTTKYWINFDVNSASRKKKVKLRILWQIPPTLPFFAIRMGVVSTRLNFSWLVSFQQLIDREKQMEIIIVQTPLLGELLCTIYEYWLSCICWCICAIMYYGTLNSFAFESLCNILNQCTFLWNIKW